MNNEKEMLKWIITFNQITFLTFTFFQFRSCDQFIKDSMISECPPLTSILEKIATRNRFNGNGNVSLCLNFGGKISTMLPQSINNENQKFTSIIVSILVESISYHSTSKRKILA